MVRKAAVGAIALAVLVLVVAGLGGLMIKDWFHDTDVLMFGGGPTGAELTDQPIGKVDPRSLGLSGDVLLRSRADGGLYVQDLGAADRPAVKLFDAPVVRGVSPDGRHVVAWSSSGGRHRIVRLSDLHAVAVIEGGRSVFLDQDRILVVFEGELCTRRDGVVLNLRDRTVSRLPLSGPMERFVPVGMVDGRVLGQVQARGDSGCRDIGAATLDPEGGQITTVATTGTMPVGASGHIWVDDGDATKVLDKSGNAVSSELRFIKAPVGPAVVYAPDRSRAVPGQQPSDEPSILRVALAGVPRGNDPSGSAFARLQSITATVDGKAVLAVHEGSDLATTVHLCPLPDLKCRLLADITGDLSRTVNVVSAAVFSP